jgi:Yip1 domain
MRSRRNDTTPDYITSSISWRAASNMADSIAPFFSIWIDPRATIRRIVDSDPTRHVLALAAIGPALGTLVVQWSRAMNGTASQSVLWPLWVAFFVTVRVGLGILSLYILGAVFKWSGRLLGGTASSVEVRAALAWSQIPAILGAIILLLALFAGVPMPKFLPGRIPQIDPAFNKLMIVNVVLLIYDVFIFLKCFGEVHRFSAWRALGASLIPWLIVIVVLVLVGSLTGHRVGVTLAPI